MSRSFASLGAVAACAVLPSLAYAGASVESLQAELAALKADYSARIAALEQRIGELETAAPPSPVDAAPQAPAPAASSANAFNPAISLILGGRYANLSEDPESYRIAGFLPSGDEVGPGERSFDLGESELTMSASIDPYFTGNLTFALTGDGEIEVEEAFVRTLALRDGFSLKGGRFLSGVGYLNEIHAHAWDFVDQPLAYQAFFGGQLRQDGLQLKWLAPTDVFLELGAESGNGDAYPGTRRAANGLNGVTLFAHVGADLGDNATWRGGVSWIDLRASGREYEDVDAEGEVVTNAFDGRSRTWIADATLKWTAPGDPRRRYVKLQGEYLERVEDGSLTFDLDGLAASGDYRSRQSGWYAQGVYQFQPRWRVGLRYDALDSGSPRIGLVSDGTLEREDFPALLGADPERTTVMLEWNPSEFSRLRAQLAWDDARDAATDEQLFLQYIHSLGAHGAHKF
jgi:hypothetical protein